MFDSGLEVAPRGSEWDQQLETLDKHQVENHEIQIRLLRDQTGRFNADLFGLKRELAALSSNVDETRALLGLCGQESEQQRQLPLAEPVAISPQRLVGDAAGGSSPLRAAPSRRAPVLERLEQLEQGLGVLAEEKRDAGDSLQEQLRKLERLFGDSVERSNKSQEASHFRLEQLGGSFAELSRAAESFGWSMQTLDQVQGRVDLLETSLREQQSQVTLQGSLKERLAATERLVGEQRELIAQDAATARTKVDQLHLRVSELREQGLKDAASVLTKLEQLQESVSELQEQGLTVRDLQQGQAELCAAVAAQGAAAAAGIEGLESAFANALATFDQATTQIRALQSSQAEQGQELVGIRSFQSQHASVLQRLGFLEEALADSSSRHAEGAEAIQTKLEQVSFRLQACERLGAKHSDTQRDHDSLLSDIRRLHDSNIAALQEQFSGQEATTKRAMQEHRQIFEVLSANTQKLAAEVRTRNDRLEERLGLAESAAAKRAENLRMAQEQEMRKFREDVSKELDANNARFELAEATQAEAASRHAEHTSAVGRHLGQYAEDKKQLDKLIRQFAIVQRAFNPPADAASAQLCTPE